MSRICFKPMLLVAGLDAKTINAYYSRPEPAPPSDASLALASLNRKKPIYSLWYDPASFVLDAVKLGNDTIFARKP